MTPPRAALGRPVHHWPVYAVAVGGAAGVIIEQAALQSGPLRVSQPLLVIIDPIVSIALSVWLFGEYFVVSPAVLTAAAAGFVVMCARRRGAVGDRAGHGRRRRRPGRSGTVPHEY